LTGREWNCNSILFSTKYVYLTPSDLLCQTLSLAQRTFLHKSQSVASYACSRPTEQKLCGKNLSGYIGFQGEKDIEQLCCVLRVLGTPNEHIWPVSDRTPFTFSLCHRWSF